MADKKEHGFREGARAKAFIDAAHGDLLRWRRQLELLASVFGRDAKTLCAAALARALEPRPPAPVPRAAEVVEEPPCSLHEALGHELMNVYHEADAAALLVRRIGFPRHLMPMFTTPDAYWSKVLTALRDGAVADGLEALALAAGRQYPANPVFARIVERLRPTPAPKRGLFAAAREVIASVQAWPGRGGSFAVSTTPRHIEIIQRVRRHFMQLDDSPAVRLIDVLLERVTCEEARIQLGLERSEFGRVARRIRREVENHANQDQR